MSMQQQRNTHPVPGQDVPWYRQFWPWFIIALPAAAVIAGIITLYLAVSNPVSLVVDDEEYKQLNSELKAHAPTQESKVDAAGKSD